MVEEATVDCYDEDEQVGGLFSMIEDKLSVPFESLRPSDGLTSPIGDGNASQCTTSRAWFVLVTCWSAGSWKSLRPRRCGDRLGC